MKTLLSLAFLLLACHAVRAGDSKADAGAQAGPVVDIRAGTAKAAAPVVKTGASVRKSVFTASANDHNPFWPIGWVKMESASADGDAPVMPHAADFAVTSILLNEPPMAVINGKEMAEGETAALPVNGESVIVQLMAVQDGRVILRWQNQAIVVPIHRQEDLSTTNPGAPDTALR